MFSTKVAKIFNESLHTNIFCLAVEIIYFQNLYKLLTISPQIMFTLNLSHTGFIYNWMCHEKVIEYQ